MVEGFKKVGLSIAAMSAAGAVLGVLVGALAENYLLWIGVMVFIGGNFGLMLGYGFLPED